MPNCSEMTHNLFRFTHFRKNASVSPFVSHTFKTKDLKPFRFTHFQKKGGGWVSLSNIQPQTDHPTRMVVPSERGESRDLPSNLGSSLSPLASALTSFAPVNSFRFCTYEKHTGGRGGDCSSGVRFHREGVFNSFLYLLCLLFFTRTSFHALAVRADLRYPPPRKSSLV